MRGKLVAGNLIEKIGQATSPFHTVQMATEELKAAGFEELSLKKHWDLQEDGMYYVKVYDTTLIAFRIGSEFCETGKLRAASAHTDFPCLRIKPNCEMVENGYGKLNVESYGGLILSTWMDRPLSIAGKVTLRSDDIFFPRTTLVDFERPVLTVPNLAIHLQRGMNDGIALDKQKDMLPLAQMFEEEQESKDFFTKYLAKEMNVDEDEILDYELTIYNREEGSLVGFYEEFISAPRLDNITSVVACVKGLIEGDGSEGLDMIVLFDHEEIGSKTKQGAGSQIFEMIIEKVFASFGMGRMDVINALAGGYMLSVDVAHCVHPNVPDKNDPTNKAVLNQGIIIKSSAEQSYASDSEAVGILMQLCEAYDVPYQKFVNRSGGSSGGTLGAICSTFAPMRTLDVGVPLLAMHSARETMGVQDQKFLEKLLTVYFS